MQLGIASTRFVSTTCELLFYPGPDMEGSESGHGPAPCPVLRPRPSHPSIAYAIRSRDPIMTTLHALATAVSLSQRHSALSTYILPTHLPTYSYGLLTAGHGWIVRSPIG